MIGGLKFSSSRTFFFFISIGMVLTNAIVVLFWHTSVLTTGMENARQQLSLLTHIYAKGKDLDNQARFHDAMLATMVQLDARCVWLVAEKEMVFGQEEHCLAGLGKVLDDAQSSGTSVRYFSHNPLVSLFVPSSYAHLAVPFQDSLQERGVIGLTIPLSVYWLDLLKQERVIAGCLLVQALVMTTLAFFRLSHSIFRPVDRLIRLADTYQGINNYHFTGSASVGELGQLSSAVRSMLQRIDRDRSALEHTIQQLEGANRDLEQNRHEMVRAEKMAVTGRLAAGLAHEIGNPLGVVGGYLELLKKENIDWEEKLEFIRRSEGELARINGLVRQLVDCSRPSPAAQEDVHANPLVVSVVETIRQGRKPENVPFDLQIEAGQDLVCINSDGLRQVLYNVVLNAIDAVLEQHGQQGGEISLVTSNQPDPSRWQVTIRDNGIGLGPEEQASVFDPFFTTKPPGSGTGLGLTVSRSLVEGMGGRMEFRSEEHQGATVCITLPLCEAGGAGCEKIRQGGAEYES
ncbi:sensor histidine kinase [Desulfogranum mediterraneum]|uniref:sensor histidine kinase n=1 Tax=Desulfogranum mediterraneum TaxID=160661 RepID=UPI000A04D58E|nr:ATP-binding protein [Desulfogranum mediterraneum]